MASGRSEAGPLFMDSIALFRRVHPQLMLQRRNLCRTCGQLRNCHYLTDTANVINQGRSRGT